MKFRFLLKIKYVISIYCTREFKQLRVKESWIFVPCKWGREYRGEFFKGESKNWKKVCYSGLFQAANFTAFRTFRTVFRETSWIFAAFLTDNPFCRSADRFLYFFRKTFWSMVEFFGLPRTFPFALVWLKPLFTLWIKNTTIP